MSPEEYYALPSITRFVDHIQNLPAVARSAGAPAPIAFALSDAPRTTRAADVSSKKKEKAANAEAGAAPAPVEVPGAGNAAQTALAGGAPPAGGKAGKKGKKASAATSEEPGANKSKGEAAPATAADAGSPAPSMIDLRVGKIIQGAFLS